MWCDNRDKQQTCSEHRQNSFTLTSSKQSVGADFLEILMGLQRQDSEFMRTACRDGAWKSASKETLCLRCVLETRPWCSTEGSQRPPALRLRSRAACRELDKILDKHEQKIPFYLYTGQ